MNGSNVLLLFYCLHFLTGGLCEDGTSPDLTVNSQNTSETPQTQSILMSTLLSNVNPHLLPETQKPEVRPTSPPCSPFLLTTTPANPSLFRKEYFTALMVAGGLILACTILLISTLLLAWKVCQLSRRVKMLSSHSDLMSAGKCRKGSDEKGENKSETDAKETTVLMADLNQTCDETGDDGNEPDTENRKDEKEKTCENEVEQKGNGASDKEAKEKPAAVTENSSKLPEESSDSQTEKPEEESSSEDKKESKEAE